MPLTLNKPSRLDYSPLLEKIERRLQGWKSRLISRAGKLQLIKSVLLSIPTYTMSCFKFPKWLLQRIENIARWFLWARSERTRPIHLINWQVVCLPKRCGGMGVINLQLQNNALLLRWIWRLYAKERKLWAQYATMIYASRPNRDGPLFLLTTGSFFWKTLLKLRQIFTSSTRFQVTLGKNVSFWLDLWFGQPLATTTQRNFSNRFISLFEAKLMIDHLFPRPYTYYQSLVLQNLARMVLVRGHDELRWNLSASGEFSVKSIYDVMAQAGKTRTRILPIWRAAVTPSMKFFFFLFLNRRILTHDVMLRRNLPHVPGCVMCNREHLEDAVHLFFTCSYATAVWLQLSEIMPGNIVVSDSAVDTYLNSIPVDVDRCRSWTTRFITTVWFLWRERNERTFRANGMPPLVLANRIRIEADLYLKHC